MAKDPNVQQSSPSPANAPAAPVSQSGPPQTGGQAALGPAAAAAQPVPVQWTAAPSTPIDTATPLRDKARATVVFPPCAAELLSLIRTTDRDQITESFTDYFKFHRHKILGQEGSGANPQGELDQKLGDELDGELRNCLGTRSPVAVPVPQRIAWPSDCCLCEPCVTLDGNRNQPKPPAPIGIRRLFAGDAVWLFYYERMGIQQILGVILDSFATNGRLPISNGSLDLGLGMNIVRDDITAVILELMVRQTKMGLSSSVRDRCAVFQTTLGWQSDLCRGLNLDTEVNAGFSMLFHRFIYNALEYYRDRRLALAIQAISLGRPSVATLTTIRDTIDLLKKRFEPFDYGRNYYNTLAGIVWTISGMSVIRELRGTLGVPTAYERADEFIPAAYDILVLKRPVTRGEVNRYTVHRDCATYGRDILLDLEVLDHQNIQDLENWLNFNVEQKVEGYRTAYRNLTGIDLGASATAAVEQQVQAPS